MTFKKCLGGVLRFVFAAVIFAVLMYLLMCILVPKEQDAYLPMHNYYDLPQDTVDVLMIGSSHIGVNVSSSQLFNQYGIASYRCWGSIQPIWNSYYYLKECLSVQRPKVVVLEVHGCVYGSEYADYERRYKNLIGMRPSLNKIDAVMASAEEEEWSTHLLSLPVYHTRFDELSMDDFTYFPWNRHTEMQFYSTETSDSTYTFQILSPDATEGKEALLEKCEDYFRRFITLCKEENMPLLLVKSPYQLSETDQRKLRTIADIAAEYGVPFVDFNNCYEDYAINPATDYVDVGHFNEFGITKYSAALASLLKDYELPDRRQDPNHIWNTSPAVETTPIYQLQTQVFGDERQTHLDTGVQLFVKPYDVWTLLLRYTLNSEKPEQEILDAYDESASANHGLRIFRDINGNLIILFDYNHTIPISGTTLGNTVDIAIVKCGNRATAYVNGQLVGETTLSLLSVTQETLILGCRRMADGSMRDFSGAQINQLSIYPVAFSQGQIAVWEPETLPEPNTISYIETTHDAAVKMEYRFEGNAVDRYIDTGLRIFEDPQASWTILSRIDPVVHGGDIVYFACFEENPDQYHGLIARTWSLGKLQIVYGNCVGLEVDVPSDRPYTLAIQKDRIAYTVWVDGEKRLDAALSECAPYNGSLLIGAELDMQGNVIRYSGTTVYNFELVEGLLTEDAILAWNPDPLPEAPENEGSDVTYSLEAGFFGDSFQKILNTGVQLYDAADKCWTLNFLIERKDDNRGAVLSCYADEPPSYRGLLVMQTDRYTFNFVLGTAFYSLTVPPDGLFGIGVVKDGNHYRLYLDGEMVFEGDSFSSKHDGYLYLGGQMMQSGKVNNCSSVLIRALEILPGADGTAVKEFWNREAK